MRRELFPRFKPGEGAVLGDMLVDCAPYLYRGKLAGFLTRLSAGGLANVTSGGGQVPSYIVARRRDGLMTTVNHRDTEAQRTHGELSWELADVPMSRGASQQLPNSPPCVLCVSVSLWLTSVIEWRTRAV